MDGQRDRFCEDRLPPVERWPELPGIDAYPDRLNAASYLLDPANGGADLECVRSADRAWTRAELTDRVGRL
ncbi:MAG: 2-aminobenzoate-CoA ligase, partial [Actinomycetota bacterium]